MQLNESLVQALGARPVGTSQVLLRQRQLIIVGHKHKLALHLFGGHHVQQTIPHLYGQAFAQMVD
mgnify:CR=1 FL=1